MGTINKRKRADGSFGYTAQIVIKRGGVKVHSEAQTFDREPAARAWMKRREAEITKDGFGNPKGTLSEAIDKYVKESRKEIGRTKAQVLRSISSHEIGEKRCGDIRSSDIVSFATTLSKTVQPQTVLNYLSHLSAVFAIAKPAWGYPLDKTEMDAAMAVCKRLGLTTKSNRRTRRPTLEELDKLLAHFEDRSHRRRALPMHTVVLFALFSTRRQEEITRIRWDDFAGTRVLVRDMKNPGEKKGNDIWCDVPPEAAAVIGRMPKTHVEIFPYSTDAISAAFTRACKLLGIEDLRFHDLRHEGVTRLFEMGWTIPHVAAVSGHRSWQSLQRYTHVQQTGDRYTKWPWTPALQGDV
ncbi:site-specific integrase [Falsirhodobacter sp. 20TX0035]|uniref:site-specific integrase n=1 Tax=Falsirhodobacter sp. 20TX0035 TaxID=3022019 RepID=UPI00232CE763|nr:site-specific integrase [Falsirhodobacter sp. 20TX0035]MDB6454832.1 site-specific integrase [Falsirhodobacter sp. 20TX0035]